MSHQPHRILGLRVPLFDLLVDSAPDQSKEISPIRTYGQDAVYASIARDLQRLLNTRRASTGPLNPSTATVLDYGIPSFSHLSAFSATDRRTLAEILRAAISFFEPRLQNVTVSVEPDPSSPSSLIGLISCKVKLGSYLEPVTFPVVLNCREGDVKILEAMTNAPSATQTSHRILERQNG
jgi:type VI secretion system protein ImpF